MKNVFRILGLGLSAALIACGGGGGNPGSNPGGGAATPAVASVVFQLDKNALVNSGTDTAVLTVTALDTNNNPVENAGLTVAVDSGIYTPVTVVSDVSGRASGRISIGGSKANRVINATIKMGGQTAVAAIPVTGSQITLSLVPATPTPGGSATVSIKVTDVNGTGIAQTAVKLGKSCKTSWSV